MSNRQPNRYLEKIAEKEENPERRSYLKNMAGGAAIGAVPGAALYGSSHWLEKQLGKSWGGGSDLSGRIAEGLVKLPFAIASYVGKQSGKKIAVGGALLGTGAGAARAALGNRKLEKQARTLDEINEDERSSKRRTSLIPPVAGIAAGGGFAGHELMSPTGRFRLVQDTPDERKKGKVPEMGHQRWRVDPHFRKKVIGGALGAGALGLAVGALGKDIIDTGRAEGFQRERDDRREELRAQRMEKKAFRLPLRKPFKLKPTSTAGLKNRSFSKKPAGAAKPMGMFKSANLRGVPKHFGPVQLQFLKAWRGVKNVAHGASEASGKVVDHLTGKNVYDTIKQESKIPVEKFPGAGSLHNVHGTQIDPHNPWAPPKKVSTQTPFPPGKVDRYVEHRTRPEDELHKIHDMTDGQIKAWMDKNHGKKARDEVERAINRRKFARAAAGAAGAYGGYKLLESHAEEARRRQAYNDMYGTQY